MNADKVNIIINKDWRVTAKDMVLKPCKRERSSDRVCEDNF